jgi:hypothetical protein
MSTVVLIPLIAAPQTLSVTLVGVTYVLNIFYMDDPEAGWTLDINDQASNPIVCGISMVPTTNLLEQYDYLGFGGLLILQCGSDPNKVAAFEDLGADAQLYFLIP